MLPNKSLIINSKVIKLFSKFKWFSLIFKYSSDELVQQTQQSINSQFSFTSILLVNSIFHNNFHTNFHNFHVFSTGDSRKKFKFILGVSQTPKLQ